MPEQFRNTKAASLQLDELILVPNQGFVRRREKWPAVKAGVVDLRQRLDSARQLLERAERAGMEVSGPLYNLSEGRNQLIQARVAIHSFSPAGVQKFLAEGDKIAAAGKESGEQALDELSYRRKGLAVSGAILLCMIGLLVIKIRQLGK